jgi:hypothetical protein
MSGLFCIPLVVSLLLAGCGPGPADQSSDETADQYALDPDAYRDDIETVEATLYQDTQLAASDLERINGAMFQLGSKALAQEEHPLRKEKARLIMTLASRSDLSGGEVAPGSDREQLREEWETLRGTAFQSADWYRSQSEYHAGDVTAFAVSDGEIHAFNFVLDRLTSLVEQGRWEVETLMADFARSAGAPADDEASLRSWQSWASDWDRRIQAALAGLPVCPPRNDGSDYLLAHESLARAVAEMRMVPVAASDKVLPQPYQWERRFTRAETALRETRELLERCD